MIAIEFSLFLMALHDRQLERNIAASKVQTIIT